jgi:hypothetical protein
LTAALHAQAGEAMLTAPTNAPARISLPDQFDAPRTLVFPTTNITLLTIADKAGSEQIAAWVTPTKRRFPTRLDIEGIADVSAVPWPLHGFVRKKFQKAQSHPVMLDWSGDTVKAFAPSANKANVFVIDAHGRILKRMAGQADESALRELNAVIEAALDEVKPGVAAK